MRCEYLDQIVVLPEEIIITGDLNIYSDNLDDVDTKLYVGNLESHVLF